MEIKTFQKIRKVGTGTMVTIPKQYILDGYLSLNEKYKITIEPIEQNKQEDSEVDKQLLDMGFPEDLVNRGKKEKEQ